MPSNYYLIKGNPTRLAEENERLKKYQLEKYKNNEEYREKKKEYQKNYRLMIKQRNLTNIC